LELIYTDHIDIEILTRRLVCPQYLLEVLPIPIIVPEFDEVQEGKINGPTLQGSDMHLSVTGLVGSTATILSE
jgi:hypothetical protein